MSTQIHNYINGTLRPPRAGKYIDNVDPSTGQVYGTIADSDNDDLNDAVAAAQNAFPAWRDAAPTTRAVALNKLADLIEARLHDFAMAESRDNGKPLSLCLAMDIPRAVANLRAFADAALSFGGAESSNDRSESVILRQPLGVVSTISPWNLPLLLFTWKLAPALATGNCVIAKPSEVTPMTAYMLSSLANEAGFPPGVLNIVHGRGAGIGAAITAHPGIPAISFTGGTKTGIDIYSGAARHLKKVSLELGGKNPTIIFDDADFDAAVDGARMAAFTNQGQICLCGSRLFVQRGIYDRFREALVAKAKTIVIGDPQDDATQHGAMVSRDHMDKVLGYIKLAQDEGGVVLTGGQRRIVDGRCADGYFIEPTIIENLPQDCRTNSEEIFGP
ncbi:MAG: aldehyde dehydrogenase family protein, partial [Alphaproteobacteria bacterium]|nr:aldehyde dehydrogenase family protein [Alphaproteobacteria bacterium]